MKDRAVIFDIDNTLYNFVDFFAPAFRAMVHTLCFHTRLPESDIIDSFRTVYAKYRSLEYRFAVQELPALQQFDIDTREQLAHKAHVAFSGSRRKRLAPYDDVFQTLEWLRHRGYLVITYTDSPIYLARNRLIRLGLKSVVDLVVGWGPERSEIDDPQAHDGRPWFVDYALGSEEPALLPVKGEERKPCETVLHRVVDLFNLAPSESYAVGDSLLKDLAPARRLGFVDIWAEYGRVFEQKNWDTLLRVSPWHETVIRSEERPAAFTPAITLSGIREMRTVIRPPQTSLFV